MIGRILCWLGSHDIPSWRAWEISYKQREKPDGLEPFHPPSGQGPGPVETLHCARCGFPVKYYATWCARVQEQMAAWSHGLDAEYQAWRRRGGRGGLPVVESAQSPQLPEEGRHS